MKFYVLENPTCEVPLAVTDVLRADPDKLGEAPKCKRCGAFTGMLEWLPAHYAELGLWGDAFGDIAFESGETILVSDRFVECFKIAGLTGVSGFFPVTITSGVILASISVFDSNAEISASTNSINFSDNSLALSKLEGP